MSAQFSPCGQLVEAPTNRPRIEITPGVNDYGSKNYRILVESTTGDRVEFLMSQLSVDALISALERAKKL